MIYKYSTIRRSIRAMDIVEIDLEQQKLISSAIRIRILHLLADTPRTAKQVADTLGETPGNVHYHVQKLLHGNLVDLVATREVGGIVEKYYKSKGTRFRLKDEHNERTEHCVRSRLLLNADQLEKLLAELEQVLHKWEQTTAKQPTQGVNEIEVYIQAQSKHDSDQRTVNNEGDD